MPKVVPNVLKRLRITKGWSQEQLAEKTKSEGLPKLDKQTISRLERGDRASTRGRTVSQLARALGVDPAVLTGEASAPEKPHERSLLDPRSQLNVRVGTGPRNALNLVSRRYRVEPSHIVELAPFLFSCAAEESLRQRRERIAEVDRACEAARNAESDIRHLPPPNFTYSEEKIAAEYESIDSKDLFGAFKRTPFSDPPDFDADTENPFALFLRKLAAPLGDVATFEGWSGGWTPKYRVCPDEAAALVGGDRERADEILGGLVALNEMPKEIRQAGNSKERAEWVRERAEEYRRQLKRDLDDLDSLFDGTGRTTE